MTLRPDQKKAMLDGLAAQAGPERAAEIERRVEQYFGTVAFQPDVNSYMNAVLRESWKIDHDEDASAWDKTAIAAGELRIGRVVLGVMP